MKLDPFARQEVETLKALGPKALTELMDIVDKRADHRGESFLAACARLPEAWRATLLLAHVVGAFEAGNDLAEVLWDLEASPARSLVIDAFREIGEKELSAELQAVNDRIDYSMEDLEDNEMGAQTVPPPEALTRIKKKLVALVRGMDQAFPAQPR
jgi:hypothetical protein